jgi:lysozyme
VGETKGAKPGMKFTREQCLQILLDSGLARHEAGMRKCINEPDIVPTKTYVAMISLTYNIGVGGFCKSSIVKRWNAGDRYGACNAFSAYVKAKGRVLPGLVARRRGERALCVDGLDELVTVNFEDSIVPEHRPILKLGASGFWVEQAQRDLGIAVTGRFDSKMEDAVKAFQKATGALKVTGVIDAATWAVLIGQED